MMMVVLAFGTRHHYLGRNIVDQNIISYCSAHQWPTLRHYRCAYMQAAGAGLHFVDSSTARSLSLECTPELLL
jgi:hypothetical protein